MKTITKEDIEAYQQYLGENEKSKATVAKYVSAIESLSSYLSGRVITKKEILSYRERLLRTRTPQTVNGALSAINGFLVFVGQADARVHFLKIQRKAFAEEKKEISMAEYRRLLDAAREEGNERLWLLIQTLAGTGIRISEHAYITVEAAKSGRAQIRLKRKCRVILIPEELRAHLLAYARERGIESGSIFRTKGGKLLDRSNAWREMKRLCAVAGVEPDKVFPHNFRHLFVRQFYAQDHDLARLADVMGHSRIETTRLYVAVSASEHEKVLNRMEMVMPSWRRKIKRQQTVPSVVRETKLYL
ncbi:MAG: tyrosine-type recombinase/integrase [Clostridiales bacterium]|nr:tyrosine-type recombinase/integrase [Clostridiales bacterium]